MTDILAPLPPATPATPSTPSVRAESVSRSQARFGPALAEAQRDDAGRSDTSERASESSEPDRETTEAGAEVAPKAERPPSSTEEESTSENDSQADDRPVADGEPPRTTLPAEPTDSETTTTSDLLVGRTHDHPTAKGAVGDGGPSTDPTVERAAPPDIGALAMARSASPEVTNLQPTSSSGHPGADAPTELAASAPSPGAASSTAGDGTMAGAPGSTMAAEGARTMPGIDQSVGSSVAPGSKQTAVDDVDGSSATQVAATANDVLGQAGVAVHDGPESAGERPAVVTAERALLTGPTQTGDAASAAGADATRSVDGAKLTQAASAAPSAAPLDPTVGSLWDDVRSGLERMRTSADGQEVRIRLRPAELGELIVQVRTNGDQVAVRLVTTSAAAQQALVDDRLRLAAELARAGFEQGSVDIGQEGATPFGQSAQDANDERGRGRTVDEPAPAATERALIEQRDPILTQLGRRPGRHAYSTINLTL